jgi:hypothetical protein
MVNYICDKCNKYFERKSTFIKHISKKKSCLNDKHKYICKYCLNNYNHKSSLCRHYLICDKKTNNMSFENCEINNNSETESENNSSESENNSLDNENNSVDNENNLVNNENNLVKNKIIPYELKLNNKIDSLTNKMESLTNIMCQIIDKNLNKNSIHQNKIIVNNINNGNININNVSNDNNDNFYIKNYNESFVKEEDMIEILTDSEPVMKGIELVYCNKTRPENHSILTTDKVRNNVLVYMNGEWINKNKNYFYRNIFNHIALQIDNLIKKENNITDETGIYDTYIDLPQHAKITYKGIEITNFVKEKKYFYNPINIKKTKGRINNMLYNSKIFVSLTKVKNKYCIQYPSPLFNTFLM